MPMNRRKMDYNNPALQSALLSSQKGHAAVPGVRGKGILQRFAGMEGSRLGSLDTATMQRKAAKEAHANRMKIGRGYQDLAASKVSEGFRQLKQSKRGFLASLPVQAITTGLAFSDARKTRQAAADAKRRNKRLAFDIYSDILKRDGPEAANQLLRQYPQYFKDLPMP